MLPDTVEAVSSESFATLESSDITTILVGGGGFTGFSGGTKSLDFGGRSLR